MPPFKVAVTCLDCSYNRNFYFIEAGRRADKHAATTGHDLALVNKRRNIYIVVKPQIQTPESW